MAGSSVAGMIVGTVFIIIFASATVTLVENVNKAQEASKVELPNPELTLAYANWTWVELDGEGNIVYTITNTGTETVNIDHIFLSKDGGEPFSCSTLTWDSSPATYIFPGETINATESGLDAGDDDLNDNPQIVFLAVFEYSLAVSVT